MKLHLKIRPPTVARKTGGGIRSGEFGWTPVGSKGMVPARMAQKSEVQVEFVDHEQYVEARYLGTYALPRFLKQMGLSARACEERGRDLLLVDLTRLSGYRPTVFERHEIGSAGATLSRNLGKVAVVLLQEQIPEKPETQEP